DPDVDGECARPLVGKKHHAICDLHSDSRQRAQVFSELGISQRRPRFEIRFARIYEPRSGAEVFRAITKRAFLQFRLRSSRDPLRRWKRANDVTANFSSVAEA